jgi:hypothetical protein
MSNEPVDKYVISPAAHRTLCEGQIDWVGAGDLASVAMMAGVPDQLDQQVMAIGVLAELLLQELMVPGGIREKKFVPWDCTPLEAFEEISRWWLSRDWKQEDWPFHFPTSGDLFWLDLTPKGKKLVEELGPFEYPGEDDV